LIDPRSAPMNVVSTSETVTVPRLACAAGTCVPYRIGRAQLINGATGRVHKRSFERRSKAFLRHRPRPWRLRHTWRQYRARQGDWGAFAAVLAGAPMPNQ